MMKVKITILIVLLALALPAAAMAQEEEPPVQNPVAAYLAGLTGLTYEEVIALQQEEGYGLGGIGRAYLFSEATGVPLLDALAQAKEIGWGNLFKEAGLHPSGAGLGSLFGGGQLGGGPPEGAGPPDGVGPPEGAGPPSWAGQDDVPGDD